MKQYNQMNAMAEELGEGDVFDIGTVAVTVLKEVVSEGKVGIIASIGGVDDDIALFLPRWMPLKIRRPVA